MLASDDNNPNFIGARNPDSILTVRFYKKSIQNNFESEKQGKPVYFEADFVEIMTPGNQLNVIDTFVREEHKRRFPIQWQVYQNSNKEDDQVVGTPLGEWPAISRSQADELKAAKFFTVEQIAGCSDLQSQALGMNGPVLRQKAQAFLKSAKDSAFVQQQAAELSRKEQEISDLKAEQERMAKQLEALTKDKPKRKYTKRVNNDNDASAGSASQS